MSTKTVISTIWEWIKKLFSTVASFVKEIIKGILNFFKDVVEYFKKLSLDPKKDIPFVIEASKLKQQIKNAPVVDVGIFEGVYREDTDEITDLRLVEADELDEQTKNVLSKAEDGIVALS